MNTATAGVVAETVPLNAEELPFPAAWKTNEVLKGILEGHLKIEGARRLKGGAVKPYAVKIKGKMVPLPHLVPMDKAGLAILIPSQQKLFRSAAEFASRRMSMALRSDRSKPKQKLFKTAVVTARRIFGSSNPTKTQVNAVLESLTKLAAAA